ncbi:hypothetical protein [Streptomyces sp. SAS_270]|uniref:hypothetical protein n=1 Tax=Streptomyces sp. SAS_270 TaxID=3412748 RepID=UPI00403C220D
MRALAEAGERFGVKLDPKPAEESSLTQRVREKADERIGRHGTGDVLMLRDLRKIYTGASGVSIDWEMLAQAAQALKDAELLKLVQDCHPDTLRQMRWANAELKEASPQVLVS